MTQVLIHAAPTASIEALATTLQNNGYAVECFTGQDARDLVHRATTPGAVLITDNATPSGEDSALTALPRIVVEEKASIRAAVAAIRSGAVDYLPMPVDADELMASVEQAKIAAQVHRQPSNSELTIIGDSAPIVELRARIDRVAATDSPVLIQGEPGSGKELTARTIHSASNRSRQPLITVSCGTIPADLLEAELFGRAEDSARSPASQGLVDAADGGTLFLDEVAELPAEVQARLLRLLQVGELRPVGSAVAHTVNVRIVAATHRDIGKLVANGQFREDLYYRLNIVTLNLPPLRSRGEDILLLANWLLTRKAAKLGRSAERFAPEAREALLGYNWPGNVRELANAVERAVILADAPVISAELLAIDTRPAQPAPAAEGQDQTTLEDYFVRFVLENEEHCTETELAEKLGISRKSLWERRQRLDIPRRKTKKRTPRRDTDNSGANSGRGSEKPASPEQAFSAGRPDQEEK